MNLPIVAIIGRSNVGKSTLFNRFVGYRKAIVSPTPGTTRDRSYFHVEAKKPFLLVDTGGIETEADDLIKENIIHQAQLAISDADLIVFMIDAKEPINPDDHSVAKLLRKSGKKILLVASKCDSMQEDLSEYYKLGFGSPSPLSAAHYLGVQELQEEIEKEIPKVKPLKKKTETIKIAIVGRPNVGKSSLINKYIGSDKLIVSDIPGTTVDSNDIELEVDKTHYTLVDTAGIRRRGKIQKGVEKYSFMRSLGATEAADVCALLIDGKEGITNQDQHVVDYVLQEKGGLILVVNKIDLFDDKEEERDKFIYHLQRKFDFVPWAPVVFISAKNGKNIEHILRLAKEIKERRKLRIPTGKLNDWLTHITLKHRPSGSGLKIPKLYYMTQVDINPPHFIIFCNQEKYIHFSYARYLENRLREDFEFEGTAIKVDYRNKEPDQKRRPSRRKHTQKK
jgi:GTPase